MSLTRDTAKNVMGWRSIQESDGQLTGHPPESDGSEGERRPVPAYAEDIAAAGLVVEEIRRNGYSFRLTYAQISSGVMARFSRQGGIDVMDYEAETAPEAICRSHSRQWWLGSDVSTSGRFLRVGCPGKVPRMAVTPERTWRIAAPILRLESNFLEDMDELRRRISDL